MRNILSHTSMRGIASLGVVLFHLEASLALENKTDQFTMFVKNSFVLVDLFFILSGFILSMAYSHYLTSHVNKKDIKLFYISRFARVYPLHIATLVFMMILVLYSSGFSGVLGMATDIIQNIFLIHAWGLADQYVFNFPSWSISVEMFAYLMFPIFSIYWRAMLPTYLVVIFLALFYAALYYNFGTIHVDEKFNLLRGIPSFLLGMVVYQYRNTVTSMSYLLLTIIQILSIFFILYIMHFNLNLFLLIPLFALLVLSTWEDRGLISKLLMPRWLVVLGDLSFTIYMLHIPIRNTMYYLLPHLPVNMSDILGQWTFVITVLILTIITSFFVYHLYEMPARKYLKNKL